MTDCIFCKIIAGDVPADKVYEDRDFLAFLDIAPVNSGHTLLVPKHHEQDILGLPGDLLASGALVLQKIASAMVRAVAADGFNVGVNNGAAAGQVVQHVHFHIIPRFRDDGYKMWTHKKYAPGDSEAVAAKIRAALLD
jgi:histidine triad (HIT) family protein